MTTRDDDVHPAPRDDLPRSGATITLNDATFAGREVTQQHFARLIGEAARDGAGRPPEEVDRIVRDAVHRSGLELPQVQVDRFVEQILRSGGIDQIRNDAGTILYPS